ncbi:MAG: hypothetical protein O3C35_04165 [Proteobacteria bacterium]|nr:hypothetical protein [Pseudomonadota bacterium]
MKKLLALLLLSPLCFTEELISVDLKCYLGEDPVEISINNNKGYIKLLTKGRHWKDKYTNKEFEILPGRGVGHTQLAGDSFIAFHFKLAKMKPPRVIEINRYSLNIETWIYRGPGSIIDGTFTKVRTLSGQCSTEELPIEKKI